MYLFLLFLFKKAFYSSQKEKSKPLDYHIAKNKVLPRSVEDIFTYNHVIFFFIYFCLTSRSMYPHYNPHILIIISFIRKGRQFRSSEGS